MTRSHCLLTCVTEQVDNWIKAYARECGVGNRVAVGDCIHSVWLRKTEAESRTAATDPVRQNVLIGVGLAALLKYFLEHDLRERTIVAYHGRLVRLGLVAPRHDGGDHGE